MILMGEQSVPPSQEVAPQPGVPLQTRGAVQPGALYVSRRVDADLLACLEAGRWALVLGPHHSGKSSLRLRLLQSLPGRKICIQAKALQATSSGAAYLALCTAVASGLGLPMVSSFWQGHLDEPPAERFAHYLLKEVASSAVHTVILIDDFEALPLDGTELVLVLRGVHDAVTAAGGALALTVGLFCAVPISRLVTDEEAVRFLSALESFVLADFSRAELTEFGPPLVALCRASDSAQVDDWLDAVYFWTAGHPQLTQHLCQQLVARAPTSGEPAEPAERLERLIQALFLVAEDPAERVEQDPCLRELAQSLLCSPQAAALLALYRRLLSGMLVTPDPLDPLQRELRLCGLCSEYDDPVGTPRLRPRCRLIASALDDSWAREQEVLLLLQEATAAQAAGGQAAAAGLLRGGQLKTAQAWARKHPQALQPPQLRVLLASLETARSEAEAKHQASAAALQRELRAKAEARRTVPLDASAAGSLSARPVGLLARTGPVLLAITGLALCLALLALVSAQRRASRAEQALQTLLRAAKPSSPAPAPSAP
jgi:hypothetical protein